MVRVSTVIVITKTLKHNVGETEKFPLLSFCGTLDETRVRTESYFVRVRPRIYF